jgi:hypothetical protein
MHEDSLVIDDKTKTTVDFQTNLIAKKAVFFAVPGLCSVP